MNYRHAFHAGNFADLVKHAALLCCLERLQSTARPLTVIDSHAGAGLYDLASEDARRSGEGGAARRLMAEAEAPAAFDSLKAAIRRANAGGDVRFYPGSPILAAEQLRQGDRLVACEMQVDAFAGLQAALTPFPAARALQADGYEALPNEAVGANGAVLGLIDPPYERPDDYARAVAASRAALKARPDAVLIIWLPLKDLETLDAFVRELRTVRAPILLAQTRLRALDLPMRLNGCALAMLNPAGGLAEELEAICAWTAAALATGPGARGLVERLPA